jgi:hypothetical protein
MLPTQFARLFSSRRNSKPLSRSRSSKRPSRRQFQLEQLETRVTPSNQGTIHLTDSTATVVEETHYAAKTDVYVYGNFLTDGHYDVEVVAPGGKSGNADDILGIDLSGDILVSGGHFTLTDPGAVSGPRGIAFNVWDAVTSTGNTNGNPPKGQQGYDDTDNPGGEYQVVIAQHQNFDSNGAPVADTVFPSNNVTKSKNFKVEEASHPTSIVTNFKLTTPGGAIITGPNAGGTHAPLGSTAQDFATVTVTDSSGVAVTEGTVDFQLFGPNGLIDDTEVKVDSNGHATDPFISDALGAGDYYFVAGFSDGSSFGESQSDSEPFTIDKGSGALDFTTTINPSDEVAVGTSVYDTATFGDLTNVPIKPTGTVTYYFFSGTFDSSQAPLGGGTAYGNPYPDVETVNSDGTIPDSASVVPLPAGSYYYVAYFASGDSNYDSVYAAAEPLTVDKASPKLVTYSDGTGNDTVTLGDGTTTLTDKAVLSGGYNPGGSITFKLYGPGSSTNPIYTNTVTVTGNGTYHSDDAGTSTTGSATLPTDGSAVVGTYYWTDTYNPDSNNNTASDDGNPAAGNDANEQTTVKAASPKLVTYSDGTGNDTITLGDGTTTLTDKAVLSGGYNPGGSITFKLYSPSGTLLYTNVVAVTGNGTYHSNDTGETGYPTGSATLATDGSTVVGTYYWTDTYNPDGNNNSASDDGNPAAGNDANEQTVVSKAQPKVVTVAGSVIQIGGILTDKATLSGAYYGSKVGGTITFYLYAPGITADKANDNWTYKDTVTVSGNGDYYTPTTLDTTHGSNKATVGGTYTWTAIYRGDGNNKSAQDDGTNESQVVLSTESGLTKGFYGNNNGEALLTGTTTGTQIKTAVTNYLKTELSNTNPNYPGATYSCLVDANGNYIKWSTLTSSTGYTTLKNLLGATATNMANMLSAQLLTTVLNTYYTTNAGSTQSNGTGITTSSIIDVNKVSAIQGSLTNGQIVTDLTNGGTSGTYSGGGSTHYTNSGITFLTEPNSTDKYVSIQTLINAAVVELSSNPNTVASGANRSFQEALKDCFDAINNAQDIFYAP